LTSNSKKKGKRNYLVEIKAMKGKISSNSKKKTYNEKERFT